MVSNALAAPVWTDLPISRIVAPERNDIMCTLSLSDMGELHDEWMHEPRSLMMPVIVTARPRLTDDVSKPALSTGKSVASAKAMRMLALYEKSAP